jgi:hypothetical protein
MRVQVNRKVKEDLSGRLLDAIARLLGSKKDPPLFATASADTVFETGPKDSARMS